MPNTRPHGSNALDNPDAAARIIGTPAARYLSDSTLAIGEVAYLIGYSEPAPFHRAFKRWYGMTPDAFRRVRRPRR